MRCSRVWVLSLTARLNLACLLTLTLSSADTTEYVNLLSALLISSAKVFGMLNAVDSNVTLLALC